MKPTLPFRVFPWLFCLFAVHAQGADAALEGRVKQIFEAHCVDCHSQQKGRVEKKLDLTDLDAVRQSKRLLDESNPAASKLYTKVQGDDMPPQDDAEVKKPLLSQQQKATLLQWVTAAAKERTQPATATARFIPEKTTIKELFQDLLEQEEEDRPFIRYLTLTTLYNAGDSDADLALYRTGVAKLLNSLSRHPRIATFPATGTGNTLLRIDLRALRWEPADWDYLLAQYPYGVEVGSQDFKFLATASGCALVHIRADWFAFAATQPVHYHRLLKLPKTVRELETSLGLDAADNIRRLEVARGAIGPGSSGVSGHNRLVERHDIAAYRGAYWKSYDFGDDVGPKDVRSRPLGPGNGPHEFQHDGGEMIFNLPNGLQAYYLSKANGDRLDVGPENIVHDKSALDGGTAIQNGISCIKCHAPGLLPFRDEVRPKLNASPASFPADQHRALARIYPGQTALDRLLQQDKETYRGALREARVDPDTPEEPVTRLVRRFLRPLTLAVAHAEVGLDAREFGQRLAQASALAGIRHDLATTDVARPQWIASFRTIVTELRLGSVRDFEDSAPSVTRVSTPPPPAAVSKDNPYVNTLGMKFVPVSGTEVLFSVWETRVRDYEAYANAAGGVDNSWKNPTYNGQPVTSGPTHPVVNVSWNDARAFSEWLTRKEQAEGRLRSGQFYRLPTDVEWSRAVGLTSESGSTPKARDQGVKGVYPWGTQWPPNGAGNYADLSAQARFTDWTVIEGYRDGYATTSPVGSFAANSSGLFDLGGNVWEWCDTYYRKSLNTPAALERFPGLEEDGGGTQYRVLRGGSWDRVTPVFLESGCRNNDSPDGRGDFLGFRCVLEPAVPKL
ncbi:MAG: SUMF1/EgtB/PvdO family nonheme iron enzyme [Verrucomicrobiae bacterium]|nr:SUMF1/EgtB/PvdO family nonheme iron enzyme [Verrucomicrobiae bacterium]